MEIGAIVLNKFPYSFLMQFTYDYKFFHSAFAGSLISSHIRALDKQDANYFKLRSSAVIWKPQDVR